MSKIEGRKYEVELEDGRTVSRQYAHYLLNKDRYNERRRASAYSSVEKIEKNKKYKREWLNKFKEEYGMPYWKWRREHKRNKEK